MNSTIQLYDATLRDGMGGGGMSLTAQEKLRVVERLDALGIDMIEAGFPSSNPKEAELFELLAAAPLSTAVIVAFGMTRRRGVSAENDEGLNVLAASIAPAVTLVGKSSPLHVEKVVRVSREENLEMIAGSVAFIAGAGKRALFDAEHFFDGWREDSQYALETLQAAIDAGAERVVLCDTNGGSMPSQITETVLAVREALPNALIGIHTHDDGGCAVANSLVAIEAGATQVQGTLNGIGERTGNANLVTINADLQLKRGIEGLAAENLARLTETAHFLDELLNRAPNPAQPYVGKNAFAHKAGMHAAGVSADPGTFEHIDPSLVGNRSEVIVSELAGRATIAEKGSLAGLDLDAAVSARIVDKVKELEHAGYQFEAADGSFELLMRRESGSYEPLFRLESWSVTVEQSADGAVASEATIVIWLGDQRYERRATGNGPVNALDSALRSAIVEVHPEVADVELVNYKVRILDESHGTDAVTRVLIDASDGERVWGTIGVGENVIAASWQALVDSLEFIHQPALDKKDGQP
ncbi:MAG: citramalate synthase [Actinobacteria bacterium]|uniref:(R)-citramalate synthase n=1 Tax=freshwater metagenome TaxID=449393 RepID=A0A6J5ZNL6_9ZZZZ|nr:citramalate synthase [Actinomycetota bacterium]